MDLRSLTSRLLQPADLQQTRPHSVRRSRKGVSVPHFRSEKGRVEAGNRQSELDRLREQLAEIPTVRTEVVARVRQRLLTGEYLSRDAAERTARAIVG